MRNTPELVLVATKLYNVRASPRRRARKSKREKKQLRKESFRSVKKNEVSAALQHENVRDLYL